MFVGKLGFLNKVVQGLGYGEYRNPYVTATGELSEEILYSKDLIVPISDAQELIREVQSWSANANSVGR